VESSNKPNNGDQSEPALISLLARIIAAFVRVGRAIRDRIRRLFGKKRGRYAPLVDIPSAAAALTPRVMSKKEVAAPAAGAETKRPAPGPAFIAVPLEDEEAPPVRLEEGPVKPLPFKKTAEFQATESGEEKDHDMIARIQARKMSPRLTRRNRAIIWIGQRKVARLHRRFPLWLVATFYLLCAAGLSLFVSTSLLSKSGGEVKTRLRPHPPEAVKDPRRLLEDIAQLISQKKYDEAQKQLEILRTLWPNDARVFQVEGAMLAGRKDYKGARRSFEKALELQPQAKSVYFNLAEVDFVSGNYEAAEAGYKKLAEVWAKNPMILFRIYLCERMQKHDQEAAEIEKNPNLKPESVEWLYVQAAKNFFDKKDRIGNQYVEKARLMYPEEGKVCELTLQRLGMVK